MSSRRRGAVAVLLAGAVAAGAVTLTACGSGEAAAASSGETAGERSQARRLALPAPTGAHAVGRSSLHLVDNNRRDPWVPKAGARELMVSMYYPAYRPARKPAGTPAPYMSTAGARAFLKEMEVELPADVLSSTRTHTFEGAKARSGTFPLVVLSPGFRTPGATLTGLAEDLASRGYVVAVVDHAYEAAGVAFPGRGILPCAACGKIGPTTFRPAAEGRAKDLRFVLDRLVGKASPWKDAGLIDKRRVAMGGHSLGGAAAAAAMADDPRVRAGVNMDGPFVDSGDASGLSGRPFLMMGTEADHSPGGEDGSWDVVWKRLEGWKRWLTLSGADHFAFTDLAPLAGQLGEDDPEGLPGQRAAGITRDFAGAFFDEHLRHRRTPLFDGPSAANPEVAFQHASGKAAKGA
ncbi:alpha/beta hydrolase family protein [Streptomyces spectabilis]|uniref:Alpha/beta hydrolase n=1 Tax=Streptomyces spectabilis TaxID=68270 RepID=A0A5P2XH21_STRST|nr:alpha/beta hydrolase [Streptomyces spectabilis]MBB5102010.1 dienelactone hydrolase [Streptomyces spectabilis]MCI3907061.1 alpha/beta hydrolase [Streptomyces spectabilis]QEV63831.1 alpha/beta hydrolase [Streptomyces spectabilis]